MLTLDGERVKLQYTGLYKTNAKNLLKEKLSHDIIAVNTE